MNREDAKFKVRSTRRPGDLNALFKLTLQRKASDLHLTANMPPVLRIKGRLEPVDCAPYGPEEIEVMLEKVLTERHKQVIKRQRSVDFALTVNDVGRFRVAAYYQRGALSVALRLLADGIPSFQSLGLPESVACLSSFRDGLVLVTGVTGSGKSTTLATVIYDINATSQRHIITVEDPIEYVHQNNRCIINQRELYSDVHSFADALRDALRADPDVILVGEMRDLETMRTAVMAAETGHLVFSTLHSRDALSSINRMVGAFPAAEQAHIRQQLSSVVRAIISQRLLPNAAGTGRVPAVEVMFATPGIANLVRNGRDEMIYSAIETGAQQGMQTMEQSLAKLYHAGTISMETALGAAKSPELLRQRLTAKKGAAAAVTASSEVPKPHQHRKTLGDLWLKERIRRAKH